MLFITFLFIWACFNGVVITNMSTLGKFVASIESPVCIVLLIVIAIFYVYCYFRTDRGREGDMEKTSNISLVVYVVIGLAVFFITTNMSDQLGNTMLWVYIAFWPLLALVVSLALGLDKDLSLGECFLRFFELEAHMAKSAIHFCWLIVSVSLILIYPAALYANKSIGGGDY